MTYEENKYWKNVLTVVPIVGAALATISYALRLFSRKFTAAGFKLEDLLMGIGLLISYCATAFVVYTAFNGVGIPVKTLPPDERHRIQFGSWMIQKFWAPSMAFIKISIVVFLKRLLGTLRTYSILSNCLIVFIAVWAVVALLVNIFQCTPPQYYYDKTLNGHCMGGQRAFFQSMGSISLIEDVIILCLPIPVVWKLQITFRQKMAITLVFSLGGLVCIFSLLRLIEFRNFVVTDLASSSAKESVWTCLEIDVAIICGCLPLMKPLVQGFLGKVKSGVSKGRSHPSSGTKLYGFHSTVNTHNDGFQKIHDPHGLSQASKSPHVQGGSSRRSSDLEMQAIAVHTTIQQDTDSRSDLNNADAVSGHVWPR
ncbi:uncharacterized protein LDX57_006882 [Aspergillus melleus]|uniref:uncharacterized protein n=1 Tax=Aspergillus melleus TaxID=138277 RepID=UPI001E8D0FC1|nr:uncharacterized protein LDX57_006882 [Aspergillus melleus]KAH8429215.1 hypothetical protein LDX57_006882 [Aspergillus melleus]